MSVEETKTYGQVFVENLVLMKKALDKLLETGISESGIILLIQAKTRMKKSDIKKVIISLREIAKEMSAPYKHTT